MATAHQKVKKHAWPQTRLEQTAGAGFMEADKESIMIKLTYAIICDLCKKECDTEHYECANHPGNAFPRPSNLFTYGLQGTLELCNDCAAPIVQAKHDVVADHIRTRVQS